MYKRIIKISIVLLCFLILIYGGIVQEQKLRENNPVTGNPENDSDISADGTEAVVEVEETPFVFEYNPDMRVVIRNSNFAGIYHDNVLITSESDCELLSPEGEVLGEYKKGKTLDFEEFGMIEGESLVLKQKGEGRFSIDSLTRAQGVPFYRGNLEIYKEKEGYVIVNEVPMEEYLLSVVPSEMPSTYPKHALAAQAICARSYAYSYLANPGYEKYNAHMDDSTSYQVYNNIDERESTSEAVVSTAGVVLLENDRPVPVYFFSTSCGYTSNENVWRTKHLEDEVFKPVTVAEAVESSTVQASILKADAMMDEAVFEEFITGVDENSLEADEKWYRWSYTGTIDADVLLEELRTIYNSRPEIVLSKYKDNYISMRPGKFNSVLNMEIVSRLPGGVADELLIETDGGTFLVKTEYYIRMLLSDENSYVICHDGSKVKASALLPSAYICLDNIKDEDGNVTRIDIKGGGFGHGVGMSQNGARQAALLGWSWEEILTFFYGNLELKKVSP